MNIDTTGKFIKKFDADFLVVKYSSSTALSPYNQVESIRQSIYTGAVGGCISSDKNLIGPNYLILKGDLVDGVFVNIFGDKGYGQVVNITKTGTPWNEWPKLSGRGKMTYSCEGNVLKIGKREFLKKDD